MCSYLQLRHSPGDLARNCIVGTRCFALPTECLCLFFFSDALLFGCDIGALSFHHFLFFSPTLTSSVQEHERTEAKKGLFANYQITVLHFSFFFFFFTFNTRRQHALLPLCQCALFCCLCGVEPFFFCWLT